VATYTAHGVTTLTTAKSLLYLACPSDAVLEILNWSVSNTTVDTGDQAQFVLQIVTDQTNVAGTTITPAPMAGGEVASGVTCYAPVTTEPDGTAGREYYRRGVNVLQGYEIYPDRDERPIISPGIAVVIKSLTTITSAVVEASITWRELGG